MARVPYARDVAAVEEAVRQAIGQLVSAALHAYRDDAEVVTPIEATWSKHRPPAPVCYGPMKAARQPSTHDTESTSICDMTPV